MVIIPSQYDSVLLRMEFLSEIYTVIINILFFILRVTLLCIIHQEPSPTTFFFICGTLCVLNVV